MRNYPKTFLDALNAIQHSDFNKENAVTTEVPNSNILVTWSAPKDKFIIDGFNLAMCLKSSAQKIISVHFIASGGSKDSSFLWNLLTGVFKDETLVNAEITIANLNEVLTGYKQKFPAFTTKIEEINYFRIEEERDDCRLIVSVDPPTGTIRYTITKPVDSGIITPVHQYFEEEYVSYKFRKHEKLDGLNFWERLSFDKYPLCINNLQKFEIVFGLYFRADPIKHVMRSYNRQRKYVGKFITVSTLYANQDSFGKGEVDKHSEQEGIAGYSLLYYQVKRFYTLPEYKMIILSQPMETESGAPLASMMVIYQPLYAGPVPEAGWAQHDLVYQADK